MAAAGGRGDRGEVGRHVFAARLELEGHLGLGGPAVVIVVGLGVDDVFGDRFFGPDEAGGHRILEAVTVFEAFLAAGDAADDAIEVRAGLAALHDLVTVGRDDHVARLAFLEGLLAFGGIAFGEGRCGEHQESCGGGQNGFHSYLICLRSGESVP